MVARRLFALAVFASTLAACGALIGIEGLTVDPLDASAATFDRQAPDVDVGGPQPKMDADVMIIPDGAVPPKRVFVTSTGTTGDLVAVTGADSGVAGANALCNAAASKLGKSTWVAWLSDGTTNAIDRIPRKGPYVLLNGVKIADTYDMIASGTLLHPINVTENDATAPNTNTLVWTGTRSNGVASDVHCGAWKRGDVGALGAGGSYTESMSGRWTDLGPPHVLCNAIGRLYCFEQ